MRIVRMKPAIGLLAGLLSIATVMATPAAAARHHHRRNHRRAGGGAACGAGTVNTGGVCTPTGSPRPVGNANVVIVPSDVTIRLDGTFDASGTVSGLPPLGTVKFNNPIPCGAGQIQLSPSSQTTADANGRIFLGLRVVGGSCVPGTYPIIITETASPFQVFTGFITLHF